MQPPTPMPPTEMAMTLSVNEIFFSIQGESTYAGLPCVFIRLAGCNLQCTYCDTTYAHPPGDPLTIPEILARIRCWTPGWVEVTGGEPLLQAHTPELIRRLLSDGYRVLLETNGSFFIGKVDPGCVRIVDIKCPSSGESPSIFWPNLDLLTPRDQIKFVVQNFEDYLFAKAVLDRIGSRLPEGHRLFSPVASVLPPRDLAEWILRDRLRVRLHLQLHKILWPESPRGR